MYWRFGPASGEPAAAPLLYDEVGHFIRRGEGPWIGVPRHPALILCLLLHMHKRDRAVSADEICAFLKVRKGTRIKGHVEQLRKKIAECGVDPKLVIAHATHQGGYRLADGVGAAELVEADAVALIDKLLARPETADPAVRDGLAQLRMLLTVGAVVALAYLGRSYLQEPGGPPVAQLEEGGDTSRTLLPPLEPHSVVSLSDGSSVRRDAEGYVITLAPAPGASQAPSACFELPHAIALGESDVLAFDVGLSSPHPSASLEIGVQAEAQQGSPGGSWKPFELRAGGASTTLRLAARELDPAARAAAKRICIGTRADGAQAAQEAVAIRLRQARVESAP